MLELAAWAEAQPPLQDGELRITYLCGCVRSSIERAGRVAVVDELDCVEHTFTSYAATERLIRALVERTPAVSGVPVRRPG